MRKQYKRLLCPVPTPGALLFRCLSQTRQTPHHSMLFSKGHINSSLSTLGRLLPLLDDFGRRVHDNEVVHLGIVKGLHIQREDRSAALELYQALDHKTSSRRFHLFGHLPLSKTRVEDVLSDWHLYARGRLRHSGPPREQRCGTALGLFRGGGVWCSGGSSLCLGRLLGLQYLQELAVFRISAAGSGIILPAEKLF